jgi:DNA-binding MarR family transcriptional regulator
MDDDAFPRSIDERERRAWFGLVSTITLLPAALESQLQRESGVSLYEFRVMAALLMQPDHTLQLKDLASVTDGSLSRLSHVVTRLGRRGWVRRYSERTGRATQARLTDRGRQKVVETAPGHIAEVRRLVFDVLSAEQVGALEEITGRINTAIGAQSGSSRTS